MWCEPMVGQRTGEAVLVLLLYRSWAVGNDDKSALQQRTTPQSNINLCQATGARADPCEL